MMMVVLLSAGRAAGQGRRRPPLIPAHWFSLARSLWGELDPEVRGVPLRDT